LRWKTSPGPTCSNACARCGRPRQLQAPRTNRDITEEAARTFAGTAERLRAAGVPAEQVSHFLTQCLFCFFAEDVGLLPGACSNAWWACRSPRAAAHATGRRCSTPCATAACSAWMTCPGSTAACSRRVAVPELAAEDVAALKAASALNWSAIDASIFGTLFERGLDPAKRSQLGANYTDPATIMRLVEPVVQRPLLAEWAAPADQGAACGRAAGQEQATATRPGATRRPPSSASWNACVGYRVLDPACGSGNFLYLALKLPEGHRTPGQPGSRALGLERQHDVTGPHNVLGIELNEYAAELARVTVWIGELQWRIQRGYGFKTNPVLEPLDHIECRDAVLGPMGTRRCGRRRMRWWATRRSWATRRCAANWATPTPRRCAPPTRGACRVGRIWFVIGSRRRGGRSNVREVGAGGAGGDKFDSWRQATATVLDAIVQDDTRSFEAWSDEPWVNDGAAVRVSLVAFGSGRGVANAGRARTAAIAGFDRLRR
jgi:hypothetical protein